MKNLILILLAVAMLSGVAWAWCRVDYACKNQCVSACVGARYSWSECNYQCTKECMVCEQEDGMEKIQADYISGFMAGILLSASSREDVPEDVRRILAYGYKEWAKIYLFPTFKLND